MTLSIRQALFIACALCVSVPAFASTPACGDEEDETEPTPPSITLCDTDKDQDEEKKDDSTQPKPSFN